MNTKTVEIKPWYQSKTLWVNIGIGVIAVLGWLLDQQNAGLLPFTLDARWVAFAVAAINFWLRTITEAPVSRRTP